MLFGSIIWGNALGFKWSLYDGAAGGSAGKFGIIYRNALPPGSCWSDCEGFPPAVGVCVLDFGEALASVRRVVAPVAPLPCCGSSVPQVAPGPV